MSEGFFKKPRGIRPKFIFTFLVLATIPVFLASVYGIYYSVKVLEDTTLHHLESELSSKTDNIEKFLKTVHKDVLFLSRSFAVTELVDYRGPRRSEGFERLRKRVEAEGMAFSQTHPYYYQVRYLDEKGYEVVRVDSDGMNSAAVPPERLQYKGDRYYFKDSMGYSDGECYVSPMDLNVEKGEVELPHKPVVRVATPLFDAGNRKKGIIIVNLQASYLIEQLKSINISKGGTTFLVNRDGFYLSRINSETGTGAFDIGSTEGLGRDYSIDVVSGILSGRPGTIRSGRSIISYAPIFTGDSVSGEYWVLAIVYPKKTIFASVGRLEIIFAVIGFLTAFAASVMGVWMARRFTMPILELHHGVEWIAKGDFDHKLDISTGDEIESLANRLNAMGDSLKASRERMERWNEDLKKEVENRTKELKIEKNKLENIMMSAREGIVVADEADRIIILNQAAETILCVKRTEMLGKCIYDCHKNLEQARDFMDSNEEDPAQTLTTTIGSRTIEISGAGINYEGEKFGSRIVLRDITERNRLMEERMTMERQLFHADKLVSIGELSAGIAHEIGNPLAAIKTVIQAMDEDAPFTGEQKKYMKRILKEVDRLAVFLRTFSAFAHPWVCQSSKSRVDSVLKDVIFLVRNEALKHHIGIDYTAGRGMPEVNIDPDQLKQVFMNIFLNAIQAISDSGTISVSTACSGASVVTVSISDTGPGIPQENIEKIFDPFFTTKQTGTGLGLSIVHRIIKEHKGEVNVRSEMGKGTTFDIVLPAVTYIKGDAECLRA